MGFRRGCEGVSEVRIDGLMQMSARAPFKTCMYTCMYAYVYVYVYMYM